MNSKAHGFAALFLVAAMCLLPIWSDATVSSATVLGVLCLIIGTLLNIAGFLGE